MSRDDDDYYTISCGDDYNSNQVSGCDCSVYRVSCYLGLIVMVMTVMMMMMSFLPCVLLQSREGRLEELLPVVSG